MKVCAFNVPVGMAWTDLESEAMTSWWCWQWTHSGLMLSTRAAWASFMAAWYCCGVDRMTLRVILSILVML